MARPVRNDGERLLELWQLEDRDDYLAAEVAMLAGRNKSRILQICRRLNLGTCKDLTRAGQVTRFLTKNEVERIFRYFDEHGRRQRHAPWRERIEAEGRRPVPAQRSAKRRG